MEFVLVNQVEHDPIAIVHLVRTTNDAVGMDFAVKMLFVSATTTTKAAIVPNQSILIRKLKRTEMPPRVLGNLKFRIPRNDRRIRLNQPIDLVQRMNRHFRLNPDAWMINVEAIWTNV